MSKSAINAALAVADADGAHGLAAIAPPFQPGSEGGSQSRYTTASLALSRFGVRYDQPDSPIRPSIPGLYYQLGIIPSGGAGEVRAVEVAIGGPKDAAAAVVETKPIQVVPGRLCNPYNSLRAAGRHRSQLAQPNVARQRDRPHRCFFGWRPPTTQWKPERSRTMQD